MRLTEHFDSSEWDSRDGVPCPRAYARQARKLCTKYLEPLRAAYGPVTVVSGFRSSKHNERVGGAPLSMHLDRPGRYVAAADVRCRRGSPAEWHELLDGLGVPGLGLYDTHVHVDNRPYRARW